MTVLAAQRYAVGRAFAMIRDRPGAFLFGALLAASALALPLTLAVLERHPYSTQAFLPLICTRFLVCVAPTLPDGEPDLSGLRAFVCGPGQGINYRPGVWHHGIVALDAPAEFAMLAWEDGSSGDCEERRVEDLVIRVS